MWKECAAVKKLFLVGQELSFDFVSQGWSERSQEKALPSFCIPYFSITKPPTRAETVYIWKDTFSSVFFWDGAVKSEWGYFKKTLADSKVVPFSSFNSHKISVCLKNIYKLKAISCISYAYVLAVGNSTKASLNWGIWALPLSFNHGFEMQLRTSIRKYFQQTHHNGISMELAPWLLYWTVWQNGTKRIQFPITVTPYPQNHHTLTDL